MSLMHICPSCGKTVDINRRYCNCHAWLGQAKITVSAESPEVKPCNFETEGLNCSDCPEDCMYCASFSSPETNSAGFGGQNCRHQKTGTAQCYCCQAQVKITTDWQANNVSFSRLAREVLKRRKEEGKPEDAGGKNIWLEAADVIRDQMEEPILDRIRRKWERAV